MKVGVAAVVSIACGSPAARPLASPPPAQQPKTLDCSRDPKPSGLSTKDPLDGGYRRLSDDTAVQTVRTAIADGPLSTSTTSSAAEVLSVAIHDLRHEIQQCMKQADGDRGVYVLEINLVGGRAATLADTVSVKRIAGVLSDGTPQTVTTTAEPCIASLLQHIELPPDARRSALMMILRFDFCSSTL